MEERKKKQKRGVGMRESKIMFVGWLVKGATCGVRSLCPLPGTGSRLVKENILLQLFLLYHGNHKVTIIAASILSKLLYTLLSLMAKVNTSSLTRQDNPIKKLEFTSSYNSKSSKNS